MIGGKTKDEVWEDMDKKRAVSRRRETAGSVAVWDCPCGYSFHVGVKICKKCGNPQPLQND